MSKSPALLPLTFHFGAVVLPLVAALHCSGDPASSAASPTDEPDDPSKAADDPSKTANPDGGGGGSGSDSGTVDTGRDAGAVVVCGGSKGTPSAVPILDWTYQALGPKYAVPLGVKAEKSEPSGWSATGGEIVTGTRVEETASTSTAMPESGNVSKSNWTKSAMPETETVITSHHYLGWTGFTEAVYDLTTTLSPTGWKEYRTTGSAGHASTRRWRLDQDRTLVDTFVAPNTRFVDAIRATRGAAWLFSVHFDATCKASQFDALVGSKSALDMLSPKAAHTRAEVSQFLVDNNARLTLRVMTVGEDATVKNALNGTKASAATLDALDATMKAVRSAIDAYWKSSPPAPSYESVAAGTNASWVIGQVETVPVDSL